MNCSHLVQFFVHGADQHLTPEALDGALGLALLLEPVEHRNRIQVLALEALARNGAHSPADRDLIRKVQILEAEERTREMGWRRKHAALQHRNSSPGFDEVELAMKADLFRRAQSLVEIE